LKDSRGSQLNTVVQGWNDENGNGVFDSGEASDENLISLGGNSVAALANANFRVASPALQLVSTLLLGRHSLITFIDALQSVNLTDIQATPSITVMDHREARIQVGERTPVRTIDAGAAGGGDNAPRATVRTENTGIILRVTPHIVGNSQVMLELHAERSNIAAAPSDLGFTFQTQEAQTQVLVDNGETAVIGGLTIIDKTESRAGIPILMDLPVIGALFRQTLNRETKRDLLIMVTPHIVREGTP
jgi:type II secretory pathway component GspD/PulD (secretin)